MGRENAGWNCRVTTPDLQCQGIRDGHHSLFRSALVLCAALSAANKSLPASRRRGCCAEWSSRGMHTAFVWQKIAVRSMRTPSDVTTIYRSWQTDSRCYSCVCGKHIKWKIIPRTKLSAKRKMEETRWSKGVLINTQDKICECTGWTTDWFTSWLTDRLSLC